MSGDGAAGAACGGGGGQQGAFTYELKGNGTAVITKFDWSKHSGGDVYVPRSIDGYQVTTIGKMAFSGRDTDDPFVTSNRNRQARVRDDHVCSGNAVAIILPDTITVIEEKAFFWTRITACDIPASVQIIEPGAFAGCINIRQFSVNSGNRAYAVIDGVLFHKAQKELVAFPFNRTRDGSKINYTIPDGIHSIGEYAFYCVGRPVMNNYDRYITSYGVLYITFPTSLKTIDDYAFFDTEFAGHTTSKLYATHIGNYAFAYSELPDHYENWAEPQVIGDYAFYSSNCSGNYTQDVPISGKNLTSIGVGAFMNSIDVELLDFASSQVTKISAHAFDNANTTEFLLFDLPQTVQVIESYAFANATLSLTIPARVTDIHSNAFSNSSGHIAFADASSLRNIGDRAFYSFETTVSDIVLPDGVKSIGEEAFYTSTNKGVALLSVPSSVTEIGDSVVNRTITVLQVEPGSYADIWASENGFPMQVNDTSWLFE